MTNEELVEQLEKVRANYGAITPTNVVDAARDPDNPMHVHFEWDDTEAAEAWRRQQARTIIARVRVTVEQPQDHGVVNVTVRGMASVETEAGREYLPVSEVASDKHLREQVLADIRRAFLQLQFKFGAFSDLFDQALAEMSNGR